jgi:hypothetical protein
MIRTSIRVYPEGGYSTCLRHTHIKKHWAKRDIHLVATQEPHIYEVNVSSARTPISVNQSIILLTE